MKIALGIFVAMIAWIGFHHNEPVQQAGPSYNQSTELRTTAGPVQAYVIATGLYGDMEVDKGQVIHVTEGMIDGDDTYDIRGEAKTLIMARQAGNRSGMQRAYDEDIYRHYGNDGEDKPPLCKVAVQDPVGTDTNQDLGYLSPNDPIKCFLGDGTVMWATNVSP